MSIYSSPMLTDSSRDHQLMLDRRKERYFAASVSVPEASAHPEVKWRVPLSTGPAELAFPEGQAESVTYIPSYSLVHSIFFIYNSSLLDLMKAILTT